MVPTDRTLLVFFAFLCHVQCYFQDADPNQKHVRTLNRDRRTLRGDVPSKSYFPSSPASRHPTDVGVPSTGGITYNRGRTRRQIENEKFSWVHSFTISENQPTSLTKEKAYVWQDSTKRLKHVLENDAVIEFPKPSGLRISIPANNVNIRIVDVRAKLNDEFRANDGGHFVVNSYKRGGMWVYEIPQLKLKAKDRVFYWIRLALSKEAFDVIVKGVVEIASGNPHVTDPHVEAIPFRPTSPVFTHQIYGVGKPPFPGDNRGGFTWNHQFTINATYSNVFTKEFAENWGQHLDFIKRFLEKNINFQFQSPTGLVISIPDDSIIVSDFRIKLNDEFRENDSGHFAPNAFKRGNMWTYNIPQLRIQQGDRVYYQMMVKRSKDGFDAIVKGLLEISQGNPHTESNFVATTSAPYQYNHNYQAYNSYSPIGGGQQPIGIVQQPMGSVKPIAGVQQPIGSVQKPVGGVQQQMGSVQPIGGVKQPIGSLQKPIGVVQQPMGSIQQPMGSIQQPVGTGNLPSSGDDMQLLDRFGDSGDSNEQGFHWEHKFTSINLNKTSEAGINSESADWAEKADEYLKKTLDRDIKFVFLNPSGLRIILSGDDNNLKIFAFNIKLNEEFKRFDASPYQANISRTSDGKWNYFYPNLKLKQGDVVYYWMQVTFGKESWYYVVQGLLKITLGDPHKQTNLVKTTTPVSKVVYTRPSVANLPVTWEHVYSINKTSDDLPAYNSPEEAQLLKHTFEDDIDFKFLNPSGLNILFSGEDKDFILLALNMKLNEDFSSLGSGDYVANVTKVTDGRWSYYYPNLKIKLGDTIYYWMRVTLGKDRADYIIRGHLKLTHGDPHIGGRVPDGPPPVIWTQAQTRPSQSPEIWTNPPKRTYQMQTEGDPHIGGRVPDVPPPVIWTQAQTRPPQSPVIWTNPPKQPSQVQNPIVNQLPTQTPQTETPVPINEPLNRGLPTQTPIQRSEPLRLSLNQPPRRPNSANPTQLCADSQTGLIQVGTFCKDGVVVRFNRVDGTQQIIIGAK